MVPIVSIGDGTRIGAAQVGATTKLCHRLGTVDGVLGRSADLGGADTVSYTHLFSSVSLPSTVTRREAVFTATPPSVISAGAAEGWVRRA